MIIVAYKGDEWIPACIKSLVESTRQPLDILLVDNAFNENLYEDPVDPHVLRVVKTPNPMGFADANNFALQHVPDDTETVCFLNQDTISTPGWFDRCLAALENDLQLGSVSPMLRSYDGNGWDTTYVDILRQQPNFSDAWLNSNEENSVSPQVVQELPATAMVVKWPVLLKSGPFDPIFGSYYEDFDLCLRLRQCGAKLAICPDAFVRHFSGSVSRSKEAQLRRARWVLRNRVIYRLRQGGAPRWRLFLRHMIYEFSYQFIRACLGTKSSKPITAVTGAFFDLLKLVPRLISKRLDQEKWHSFLNEMNWKQPTAHTNPAQPS